AAKLSPCTRVPGSAKNASPALMARLSALTPPTSSAGTSRAPAPFNSSLSAKGKSSLPPGRVSADCSWDNFIIQLFAEVGADSQHRRNVLNNTSGDFAGVPAGGSAGLRTFALRLIDHDHHDILRIIEREARGEDVEVGAGGVDALDHLFGRAGLAAGAI